MKQALFLSCLVFLLFTAVIPYHTDAMFADPDTWWHIAAGDLIRTSGAVPPHDPWSFTAGDYPWLNIAWAWDALASYIHEHAGWHGVIMLNTLSIAAVVAVLFFSCFLRSRHGIAAYLVTMLVAMTLVTSIRPFQVTYLLAALSALVLSQVARGQWRPFSLCAIPMMVALWVNTHGGFLMAFVLMGIYGLDALLQKQWRLFYWLVAAGAASLLACVANPYGVHIFEATLRPLTGVAEHYISEWQPFNFGEYDRAMPCLALFVLLVVMRPGLPVSRSEKWVAYLWLLLGLTSARHMALFAIVSAPVLSVGLHEYMKNRPASAPSPWAARVDAFLFRLTHNAKALAVMAVACVAFSGWLFTSAASAMYGLHDFKAPVLEIKDEVDFINARYPGVRLFNSYNLGGPLIFYGRGTPPVWVDGRTETAYPRSVMQDYVKLLEAVEGWEEVFDRYRIDGALLDANDRVMIARLNQRRGWKQVFESKDVKLFMRESAPAKFKR